ncbi:SEC-C domain-containing protein [Bradyrhizobium diazoefficiens]|nr:SEC-C metal-binding domain-containing protein [Bradyrhizobium diazoefficiens]MBK3666692.1 SEC-C domain-containing protein [Bradyrhizobium diazoefficiens]
MATSQSPDNAARRCQDRRIREETVGRNEACPCGSGKKYKNWCGLN